MRLFLGGAVDMFYRYGFFSLSVRVVPRDDPGKWLVREPTANIFDQQSLVIEDKAGPNTFARQPVQVSTFMTLSTVKIFKKSRIQYCERSELRLHFRWTKIY